MTNDTRACTRCETTKSLSEFAKDKHQASGYKSACKACDRAASKKYYEKAGREKRGHQAQYKKREPIAHKNCKACETDFQTYNREQKYCSRACAGTARKSQPNQAGVQIDIRTCSVCQCLYTPKRKDSVNCSTECVAKARRIKESNKNQKRRKWSALTELEPIDPHDIHQRDKWTCGICENPIDQDASWPHPKSASIDHIRPLSWGGTHTADNLQSAHLECNWIKGARGELDAEALAFRERVSRLADPVVS